MKPWSVSELNGLLDHRAIFHTGAASGAQVHFYAAGAFFDFYLEIARFTRDTLKICVCDQFDIQMPADLDQYGRNDSHCTVIGGKGFVQLGHYPADGGGFFQKVDVIA